LRLLQRAFEHMPAINIFWGRDLNFTLWDQRTFPVLGIGAGRRQADTSRIFARYDGVPRRHRFREGAIRRTHRLPMSLGVPTGR
jgi:hypothetical protein